MRIFQRRILSVILAFAMVITGFPAAAFAQNAKNSHDLERVDGSFVVTGQDGSQGEIDNSDLEEKYPYGVFALGDSQLVVKEGEETVVLKVYRLGGTTGKASAILSYIPVITTDEEGNAEERFAIQPEDLIIEVEDPLPRTAYEAWGEDPQPMASHAEVFTEESQDREGEPCLLLTPDIEDAESYQWFARYNGYWKEVKNSDVKQLAVSEEDLDQFDFRCVYILNGETFSTDCSSGNSYEPEEPEQLPEMPEDMPINPEKTFSVLEVEEGMGAAFEICFAEGEFEKEIRFTAVDNDEYDFDRMAAITIEDHIGGAVHQSLKTLLLRLEDNDAQLAGETHLGFEASLVSADKAEGKAVVAVVRTEGQAPVTVDWHLEEGTALSGLDYADAEGTLYFYDSDTAVIEIPLINNRKEDPEGVELTVVLDNLRGDSKGFIDEACCTILLINTNDSEELNLESVIYNEDAIDASAGIQVTAGSTVAAPEAESIQQITEAEEPAAAKQTGSCKVRWTPAAEEIMPMQWGYDGPGTNFYGAIEFPANINSDHDTQSLKSSGHGGQKTSVTFPEAGVRYESYSGYATGVVGFADWWDRLWYGDEEYAYSYFQDNLGHYWDCSPVFSSKGGSISLSSKNPFHYGTSLSFGTQDLTLTLGLKKFEGRESEDSLTTETTVNLYKRPFSGSFYVNLHTPDDPNVNGGGSSKLDEEYYNRMIDQILVVSGTNGGTDSSGRLYENSAIKITLGDTHYKIKKAYLSRNTGSTKYESDGAVIKQGTLNADGTSVTFSEITGDPSSDYTFNIVLARKQQLLIDLSPSAELTQSGELTDEAVLKAAELFSSRVQGGMITVGTTTMGQSAYYPTTEACYAEKDCALGGSFVSDDGGSFSQTAKNGYSNWNLQDPSGSGSGFENIQFINFNLPDDDIILFNGRSYKGSEDIYLRLSNYTTENLQFYYYNKDFLTVQRPMKVKIDSNAVYFDGNGNGFIDGYWDADTGLFMVQNGDSFVGYMKNQDYAETAFRPQLRNGSVCQYFLRPYFTTNPVSLSVPEGHAADEAMQIMPSFITDVTNGTAYTMLTPEQKAYRTIVSGLTRRSPGAWPEYSADNHAKYTEAATAYSYVDIPLGGDLSPARAAHYDDLKSRLTRKVHDKDTNTDRYKLDGKTDIVVYKDLCYYYDKNASLTLGTQYYIWEPDYHGSLLVDFEQPASITIRQSAAGNDIPIASELTAEYLLKDGTWTEAAPSGSMEGYRLTDLGIPVTRNTAKTEKAKAQLNNYLGSFADNDTYALTVKEQLKTTEEIRTLNVLSVMDGETAQTETVTRGLPGLYPDPSVMTQAGASQTSGEASSEGHTAYPEVESDMMPELFAFSSEMASLVGIETDGDEITISLGIPFATKDNDENDHLGFTNPLDDASDASGRIKEFMNGIKNGATKKDKIKDAFKGLADDDLATSNLKACDISVSFKVIFTVVLRYNQLDNGFQFAEGTVALGVEFELTLTARLTACPVFYGYFQLSVEATLGSGLGMNREAVLGDYVVYTDEKNPQNSNPVDLYQFQTQGIPRADGKKTQYAFLLKNKAFEINFTGQLDMDFYVFNDINSNGTLELGEIGSLAEGCRGGYITSDGKEPVDVYVASQKSFDLEKPIVVVLTAMDTDPDTDDSSSISSLAPIVDYSSDFYWAGFQFDIEVGIELGLGVGVEILKAEIFFNAGIGIAFVLGSYQGPEEGYDGIEFNTFELTLGLGFRIVFLFFNYEQDLISYTVQYDSEDQDDENSGWSHSWSALGGLYGGEIGTLSVDMDEDKKINAHVSLPSLVSAETYSNGVNHARGGLDTLAYECNTPEFQVSGYGASVNAFKLMDGVETGYDYQLISVNDANYIVLTGTDTTAADPKDRTCLLLYRIAETDGTYGLVSPILGNSSEEPVVLDGDGTGDLDFTVWAEDDKIFAAWVSYSAETDDPVSEEAEDRLTGQDEEDQANENRLFAAAKNTVVKIASFDPADLDAEGFTPARTLARANGRYDFLPQSGDGVVVYAQTVPYEKDVLRQKLKDYSKYVDALAVEGPAATQQVGDLAANSDYIEATREMRMSVREALLNLYGGNSRLSVVLSDGTVPENADMYVSGHQEGNNADEETNEILAAIEMTSIGGYYYVAYTTQERYLQKENGRYTDEVEITRLYLRRFTVEDSDSAASGKTIEWSSPYLLRTAVNYENNNRKDGIYVGSRQKTSYQDAYISNLKFLNGSLGDSLGGTEEDFTVFSDDTEAFLLFDMNGSTYVIRQESLIGIIEDEKGIINEFFTPQQVYGKEKSQQGQLATGKNDVVIGSDGDGNIAAVYTSSVPGTQSNAIYIAYWDPETASWGAGTMLAMNGMDIYEQSLIEGWTNGQAEAAYFEKAKTAGKDPSIFTFKNMQIALGRKSSKNSGNKDSAVSAQMLKEQLVEEYDLPDDEMNTLSDDLYDSLAALEPSSRTSRSELLVITQGIHTDLVRYELPRTNARGQFIDDKGNVVASSEEAAVKILYAAKPQDNGAAEHGNLGVYAISYGKGDQRVGNTSIRFAYDEFTEGARLHANISFANVGDAAIRASKDQPVIVKLMLNNHEEALASWRISESIRSGQRVALTTTELCKPLKRDLGSEDYFYITVEEDSSYITAGDAFTYRSDSDESGKYKVVNKPDLGIEALEAAITGVDSEGNAIARVSFNVTNRGKAAAEDVYLQMSYVDHYENKSAIGNDPGFEEAVYEPLDLSTSQIFISQPKFITNELELFASPETDLENGILRLGTDEKFYTRNFYISGTDYRAMQEEYYSEQETAGWSSGFYDGKTIWYNSRFYSSAYAAYTAGQKALQDWVYDEATGNWYAEEYGSMTAAENAAAAYRLQEYVKTAAQYSRLPKEEQPFWYQPSDGAGAYVPTGYSSYEKAMEAFEEAKNAGDDLNSSYCRTVEAELHVDPGCFNGNITGSLELKLEVFSFSSNADRNASGIYTSNHSDEHYAVNNAAYSSLQQATFISAAPRINLARGSAHRLPVTVGTTTGEKPVLTILEVEDGADELTSLYFTEDEDGDGVEGTLSGFLTIVGAAEGEGIIHIVDEATNTTYPIAYRVNKEGDGINIYNDDSQFTFYNKNGSLFDPDKLNQDWTFKDVPGWTDAQEEPYLGNLAIGDPGAYFTFETKAGLLSFNLIGKVQVSSSVFPGTFILSGDETSSASDLIDFNNAENLTHTVTVKVLDETALLDVVKLDYSKPYTPSDDKEAPGLYWSRSFPAYHSVPENETVELTVYAVDETGLSSLMVKANGKTLAVPVVKSAEGLWSQTFTVDKDIQEFSAAAVDTNGNTTYRNVKVLWFASGRTEFAPTGMSPSLDGSVYKTFGDGSEPQDVFLDTVVYTSEELEKNAIEMVYTSDEHMHMTYGRFISGGAAFVPADKKINSNGIYYVRSDNREVETWTQKIFYINCFESMPEVTLAAGDPIFGEAPTTVTAEWTARKDETSATRLKSVTVNGVSLTENMDPSAAMNGSFDVLYGGKYTVLAEDAKGIRGMESMNVSVPVYADAEGTFAVKDPWIIPSDGLAGGGVITIDFSKVSGGDYANSGEDGLALNKYYGSYQFASVPLSDAGQIPSWNAFDETTDYSWLKGLDWQSAACDETAEITGLTAPENGEAAYLVLIRDAKNPDNYKTYASAVFTLADSSIVVTSVSARPASAEGAADGQLYAQAAKGSGLYEFALLPLSEAGELTAEDFKDPEVRWITADPEGNGFMAVFDGLPAGSYQVAVRELAAADAGTEGAALDALKNRALEAQDTYNGLLNLAKRNAADQRSEISAAARTRALQAETLVQKKTEWERLDSLLASGNKGVTQAQADAARAEYEEVQAVYDQAKQDLMTALAAAGFSESEAAELAEKRAELTTGAEIRAFNKALGEELLAREQRSMTALEPAKQALEQAAGAYKEAVALAQQQSAASYAADPSLWEGMAISKAYGLTAASSPSIKTVVNPASGAAKMDGSVLVTAEFAGGTVQFAVLPLEEGMDPADFADNMAAIADLDLDWDFADDIESDPVTSLIEGLGAGSYMIFVRPAFDPDINDDYDLQEQIAGEGEDSAASLRRELNAAKVNASDKTLKEKVNEVSKQLAVYRSTKDPQIRALLLAAVGNEPVAVKTLEDLDEASPALEKAAAEAFKKAAEAAMDRKAKDELAAISVKYAEKLAEVNKQIDRAYELVPGYYINTAAAEITIPVVRHAERDASSINVTKETAGVFELVIYNNSRLSPEEIAKVLEKNAEKTVLISKDGNRIVLPQGAVKDRSAVLKAAEGIVSGNGNVVIFTAEDGSERAVPISLVENGKAVYVYMGGSNYRMAEKAPAYTDIEGHWAAEDIFFVSCRGLFEGVGGGFFAPGDSMTRAMVATVLHRFAGCPAAKDENTFLDVAENIWFYDGVVWAKEAGVVDGVGNGLFAPARPVTREQLVTMIYRFLGSQGHLSNEKGSLELFSDSRQISGYAQDAFRWACGAGIIQGSGDKLMPKKTASRAEVAAIFHRVVVYILSDLHALK